MVVIYKTNCSKRCKIKRKSDFIRKICPLSVSLSNYAIDCLSLPLFSFSNSSFFSLYLLSSLFVWWEFDSAFLLSINSILLLLLLFLLIVFAMFGWLWVGVWVARLVF